MTTYTDLFENNKKWVASKLAKDPSFFKTLNKSQSPDFLYIGCSDSRVTAEDMMGASPGEIFVHRNVANLVVNTDLNVMSVIDYAVTHLGVKHIIVCGHYGCGGVKAAMQPQDLGILNPWLRSIRDVYRLHMNELDAISDEKARYDRLVELNVREQCLNVIKTAAVQKAFYTSGLAVVHGWVFDMSDGHLNDLNIDFESELHAVQKIYDLGKVNS